MPQRFDIKEIKGLLQVSAALDEIAQDLRIVTEDKLHNYRIGREVIHSHEIEKHGNSDLLVLAEELSQCRRRWVRIFDDEADLLNGPGLDILLYLFISGHRGHEISVSSACYAANTPQTTGLRCITRLERRGFVKRSDDPFDKRRHFLALTEAGQTLVSRGLVRN